MDTLVSYATLFAASSITWMIINHKRELAQIGKPRKDHPITEIQMPVKKRKIEKIEDFNFQGHESLFGKLEKSIQPRAEKVILDPGCPEIGAGTQSQLDSPKSELRKVNLNEKIDSKTTRKNLLGSRLRAEKRSASFFSKNCVRAKTNIFHEQLNQVVGSRINKAYSTLDPVLEGLDKSVELDSNKFIKRSEKKEKKGIDLEFKSVESETST